MNTLTLLAAATIDCPTHNSPLLVSHVSCGFPSPAEEFIEEMTSLDALAIDNPPATFLLKAGGDSMSGAGIYSGDILVVDRSKKPVNKSIVVAIYEGEFVCKRLLFDRDGVRLIAENPNFQPIHIANPEELVIWGVCTYNLHGLLQL